MSKKGKPLHYNCDGCDEIFAIVIKSDSDILPETCPFCGSDLDNSKYLITETDESDD